MTIPVAVVLLALLFLFAIAVAYVGASTRAIMLQATLDQLWPFVRSVSTALQASAKGDKGTDGQA